MPKPKKERVVRSPPPAVFFRPIGIPSSRLCQIAVSLDEYEALRLVDLEGMDQGEASAHLGISRPTCARILADAHKKLADALVHGCAIRIEGGSYRFRRNRYRCLQCGEIWDAELPVPPEGVPQPCPECGSPRFDDLAVRAGWHHGRGPGGRHGNGGGDHGGRSRG
jgi:predicted DNA-binding protein (UPF0251 family)/rubredoxin